MDAPAFVADLEAWYRTAWLAWCREAKEQA